MEKYALDYRIHKCTVCSKIYILIGKEEMYIDLKPKPDNIIYVKCNSCVSSYDPIIDEHKVGNTITKKYMSTISGHIGGSIAGLVHTICMDELKKIESEKSDSKK